MAFHNFTENEVRVAILNKIKPEIKNKRAPHWRGIIYLNGEYFATVKIPNPHNKNFGPSKVKNIANQLGIDQNQYNELIKCTFSGSDYFDFHSMRS